MRRACRVRVRALAVLCVLRIETSLLCVQFALHMVGFVWFCLNSSPTFQNASVAQYYRSTVRLC